MQTEFGLCPETTLAEVTRSASGGDDAAVALALATYPEDPRLHFLQGSLLAAAQNYEDARTWLARAVGLAPGFEIARFQLGLLEFTSGQATLAEETWRPLLLLPPGHPIRRFVEGLLRLLQDDVDGAVGSLRQGIDANPVNAALNADMQRLIDELLRERGGEELTSAADMMLRQLGASPAR